MHRKFSGTNGKLWRLRLKGGEQKKKSLSKNTYCIGTGNSFLRSKVVGGGDWRVQEMLNNICIQKLNPVNF